MFKKNKNNVVNEITNIHKSLETLPNHIAIIVNNEVVDVIHCDERLGSILLSSPLFISIGQPSDKSPTTGWSYIDGKFINRVYKSHLNIDDIDGDYNVE